MKETFEQVYNRFDKEGMMIGRAVAIDAIRVLGDIYIFGIWSGVSTKLISDYLDMKNKSYKKMWGFDSFTGLPKEKEGFDRYVGHNPGSYSSISLYSDSIDNTIEIIKNGINNPRLELIPGYYKDILNKKLTCDKDFNVASFVDVDVDLYDSTVDVLKFLFKNKLTVPGTIFYFDDWGAVEEYTSGESLAWKELTECYNIQYKEIFSIGNMPYIQKVFKQIK